MIIGPAPGVRWIDDGCTGAWYADARYADAWYADAWYADLRLRHYHTMLRLEQIEPGIGRRTALPKNIIGTQHFGGSGAVQADQYDDAGQILQCGLAVPVKLPFVALPVTWLLP